jgi:hypothetical protein
VEYGRDEWGDVVVVFVFPVRIVRQAVLTDRLVNAFLAKMERMNSFEKHL